MTRYRARTCPKCRYYLGFTVTKPFLKSREISVTSFCLNCGYELPVHAVVQGGRRSASRFRRRWLQAAEPVPAGNKSRIAMPRSHASGEKDERAIRPEDYARYLRTIGQQLENLQLGTFNLECTATSYVIRHRAERSDPPNFSSAQVASSQLPRGLTIKNPMRPSERRGAHPALSAYPPSIEFTLNDLEQLDRIAKQKRLHTGGFTNGHSLSQLLRTLGALVNHRNHHLLGISWRDLSICIVVETVQGKREIDVYRPDNLYDLWVRMYLKRENRALSEVPY